MDCGNIVLTSHYVIKEEDTTTSLLESLAQDSVGLLEQLLSNFDELYNNAHVQKEEDAVYCNKITSAFGTISWMEPATHIVNMARALTTPYSGAKVLYNTTILKIWKVALISATERKAHIKEGTVFGSNKHGLLVQCRRGIIAIQELQLPGKRRIEWQEFLRGNNAIIGSILT